MQVTCGECLRFEQLRRGSAFGYCMGVRVTGGERRPVVSSGMDCEGCPDRRLGRKPGEWSDLRRRRV